MTYEQLIGRMTVIRRGTMAESLAAIEAETEPEILSQVLDVLGGRRALAARRRLRELLTGKTRKARLVVTP